MIPIWMSQANIQYPTFEVFSYFASFHTQMTYAIQTKEQADEGPHYSPF